MDTVLMNESQEGSDSALWAVDCGLWSGSVMEHMWWVRGPHFRCPGLPHPAPDPDPAPDPAPTPDPALTPDPDPATHLLFLLIPLFSTLRPI